MDEYLKILTFVVTQTEVDSKRHPEDLMHTVQTAAETVALTLIAYDQFKVNKKK
jgi:hypothetical protein